MQRAFYLITRLFNVFAPRLCASWIVVQNSRRQYSASFPQLLGSWIRLSIFLHHFLSPLKSFWTVSEPHCLIWIIVHVFKLERSGLATMLLVTSFITTSIIAISILYRRYSRPNSVFTLKNKIITIVSLSIYWSRKPLKPTTHQPIITDKTKHSSRY